MYHGIYIVVVECSILILFELLGSFVKAEELRALNFILKITH